MSKSVTYALLALALLGLWLFMNQPWRRVSGADAKKLVAEGAALVDVRTAAEFSAGHLPGAVNIPVQDLDGRLGELEKSRAVVVYCASGQRSSRASRALEKAGFSAVHDLGGMGRW